MSTVEINVNDLETGDDLQELILVDRDISKAEHKVLITVLSAFSRSPIISGSRGANENVKTHKMIAKNLLTLLKEFTRQLVVTRDELATVIEALAYFAYLQLPMNATLERIRNFRDTQKKAILLLDDLEQVNGELWSDMES
ncbi:MAG: hypothetical protein ACFFD4_26150 [Candidatus Odinarchaeota archaeon]